MEPHAARALHQRLDDDACEFLGVALEAARKIRGALLALRQPDDTMFGQDAAEASVHAGIGIADRHRSGRIAVIAALESKKFPALAHAAVEPELQRHLHGDLDRDRARLGEEHAIEIARHQRRKAAGERERLLVGKPAEHHMRHQRELALDRLADVGMVVAVAGGPPRCDAVDELASIGEHDARAMGAGHEQRRARRLHLRIGQPDMGEPGLIARGRNSLFSRHSALSMQSLTGMTG